MPYRDAAKVPTYVKRTLTKAQKRKLIAKRVGWNLLVGLGKVLLACVLPPVVLVLLLAVGGFVAIALGSIVFAGFVCFGDVCWCDWTAGHALRDGLLTILICVPIGMLAWGAVTAKRAIVEGFRKVSRDVECEFYLANRDEYDVVK